MSSTVPPASTAEDAPGVMPRLPTTMLACEVPEADGVELLPSFHPCDSGEYWIDRTNWRWTLLGCTGTFHRKLLLPLLALSGAMTLPVAAQQSAPVAESSDQYPRPTNRDNLIVAAAALNNQRSEAIRKRDLPGIVAVYTADAVYVELLPRLEVMHGRAQIQRHFEELFASRTTDLTSTVTSADSAGNDRALVGGNYSLVTGNKQIAGHFVQELRREGGAWKIASHVFARPEPVTVIERNEFRGN
jgi:uncharacterized protein (TIGR02246 family)